MKFIGFKNKRRYSVFFNGIIKIGDYYCYNKSLSNGPKVILITNFAYFDNNNYIFD